jgi:hypothetical protein
MTRYLASDEARGITDQAINVSAGSRTARGEARRLEDPDDMVYDGQEREAIAPRYGRLRCCSDPVRKSASSVPKDTGLTTPENSRSRGPGPGATAMAAACSGPPSLTMETILSSTRALGAGTGKSATGASGQGAGARSIIRKPPSVCGRNVGRRELPLLHPLGDLS